MMRSKVKSRARIIVERGIVVLRRADRVSVRGRCGIANKCGGGRWGEMKGGGRQSIYAVFWVRGMDECERCGGDTYPHGKLSVGGILR